MSKRFEDSQAFALKERIKARSRRDKKERIEACWHLLLNLHENGDFDFSVSKIGKALENHGIQNAQSYRNATGKDYYDIVEAFAAEVGARTTHQRVSNAPPLEQVISNIRDLDSQTRLRMMVAELGRLKEENQSLRREMGRMQRVPYGSKSNLPLEVNHQTGNAQLLTAGKPRKKPYISALERFTDEEWLEGHGLEIMVDGTINHANEEITLPGFAKQLKEVIDYLSSEQGVIQAK